MPRFPSSLVPIALSLALAGSTLAQEAEADRPYPSLVTAATRADAKVRAALEKPGTLIFSDGFETDDSFKSSFEVGGLKEGRAKIAADAADVRTGKGSLQLTAKSNEGKESGAGPHYWLGGAQGVGKDKSADGHDRVHIRYYIKFAPDYDQGDLNHTGGGLSGVAGSNKWTGMGGAGIRPKGDDSFSSRVEPWRDWGRFTPPGYMFCYAYWMDMKIDKDGHYWGNMMKPQDDERFVPERGRWYCVEQMIKVNTIKETFHGNVAQADGELAAWIDGKLYLHYTGFRWRSTEAVRIKRASLQVYVHRSRQDNTVWYDDFVVSTGYIGPVGASATTPATVAPAPGLAVGERAPDATLTGLDGKPVQLASLYKDGPVVLTFYRGGWCPFCNKALSAWHDKLDALKAAGGTLIALTPEKPDLASATREKAGGGYAVYSDSTQSAAKAFKVQFAMDAATQTKYKGYGIDLSKNNASATWELPAPATFVIDKEGVIRWAFADWDYEKRADPDTVIAALKALAEKK